MYKYKHIAYAFFPGQAAANVFAAFYLLSKFKYSLLLSIFHYFCPEMRVAAFFVYLFFLLLGGEHISYAGTSHNGANAAWPLISKNQQVKLADSGQSAIAIEDANLDAEEEYHSSNDLKAAGNKFISAKGGSPYSWYLALSGLLLLPFYSRRFKAIPPFRGHASPIYIIQRVLRI